MCHRAMKHLCLALMLMAACGCNPNRVADAPIGNYRTITAEPRRDTEAAKRLNRVGLEHLAAGEYDEAVDAFVRALTEDVEFGPAHNNLGKVYYIQKNWYKAAWEFEYAGKLLPRHAEPRNNLGLVLEQAGELDRAVDQYRQAVGLEPGVIAYRGNLARALIRRGDRTDEVRKLLELIVENDTRPEWVLWARQQQAGSGVRFE